MFFFFQAEDGIRDIGVTGVQTCALPISRPYWFVLDQPWRMLSFRLPHTDLTRRLAGPGTAAGRVLEGRGGVGNVVASLRSEERRVGKECRSRWSPYH